LELKLYLGAAGEVDAILDAAKERPDNTGHRYDGRYIIPSSALADEIYLCFSKKVHEGEC
jgi:hypothetical protein